MTVNTEFQKYISQPSYKVKENKVPCTFVNILAPRTTTPTVRYRQTIYRTGCTPERKKKKRERLFHAKMHKLIYYQHNHPYDTSLSMIFIYINVTFRAVKSRLFTVCQN